MQNLAILLVLQNLIFDSCLLDGDVCWMEMFVGYSCLLVIRPTKADQQRRTNQGGMVGSRSSLSFSFCSPLFALSRSLLPSPLSLCFSCVSDCSGNHPDACGRDIAAKSAARRERQKNEFLCLHQKKLNGLTAFYLNFADCLFHNENGQFCY